MSLEFLNDETSRRQPRHTGRRRLRDGGEVAAKHGPARRPEPLGAGAGEGLPAPSLSFRGAGPVTRGLQTSGLRNCEQMHFVV